MVYAKTTVALSTLLLSTSQAFIAPSFSPASSRSVARSARGQIKMENFNLPLGEDQAENVPAAILGEANYREFVKSYKPDALIVGGANYPILKRVSELKLLSLTAESGLLSRLEELGLKLSDLEKILPIVEELQVLGLLEQNADLVLKTLAPLAIEGAPLLLPVLSATLKTPPAVFYAVGAAALAAEAGVVATTGNVALDVIAGIPLVALAGASFLGGSVLSSGIKIPAAPPKKAAAPAKPVAAKPVAAKAAAPKVLAAKAAAPKVLAATAAAPKVVAKPAPKVVAKPAAAPAKPVAKPAPKPVVAAKPAAPKLAAIPKAIPRAAPAPAKPAPKPVAAPKPAPKPVAAVKPAAPKPAAPVKPAPKAAPTPAKPVAAAKPAAPKAAPAKPAAAPAKPVSIFAFGKAPATPAAKAAPAKPAAAPVKPVVAAKPAAPKPVAAAPKPAPKVVAKPAAAPAKPVAKPAPKPVVAAKPVAVVKAAAKPTPAPAAAKPKTAGPPLSAIPPARSGTSLIPKAAQK